MLPSTDRRGLAKPDKPEMSVLSQLIPNFVREPAISILGEVYCVFRLKQNSNTLPEMLHYPDR